MLWQVEKIVDHKRARSCSKRFHVKWTHFPDSSNTWETKDFILRNPGGPEALDSYMAAEGL